MTNKLDVIDGSAVKINAIDEATVHKNDVILIEFDHELFDVDTVKKFIRFIQDIFKTNDIIILPKGIETRIIHRD